MFKWLRFWNRREPSPDKTSEKRIEVQHRPEALSPPSRRNSQIDFGVLFKRGDLEAKPFMSSLTHALQHEEEPVPSIPGLIGRLAHRDAKVRRSAAEVLGKIGPHAKP